MAKGSNGASGEDKHERIMVAGSNVVVQFLDNPRLARVFRPEEITDWLVPKLLEAYETAMENRKKASVDAFQVEEM